MQPGHRQPHGSLVRLAGQLDARDRPVPRCSQRRVACWPVQGRIAAVGAAPARPAPRCEPASADRTRLVGDTTSALPGQGADELVDRRGGSAWQCRSRGHGRLRRLVTTATSGVYPPSSEPSLRRPSATATSPLPWWALVPAFAQIAPTAKRGIKTAVLQGHDEHRSGRGLAVRAGHQQRPVPRHQLGQHRRAQDHRDAAAAARLIRGWSRTAWVVMTAVVCRAGRGCPGRGRCWRSRARRAANLRARLFGVRKLRDHRAAVEQDVGDPTSAPPIPTM